MDRLETREIEYALTLADELNFTKAAARLGIAQPPLSRAIGRLERRLGVELFYRTSRSVSLTEAGAVFVREGRAILDSLDNVVHHTRYADRTRPLVVAARPATGSGRLHAIIRGCGELREPLAIRIHFTRRPTTAVREQVADVALACTTEDTDELTVEELDEQPTLALTAAAHPLATHATVTLDELRCTDGFLEDCPDLPLDEIVDRVLLQNAVILVAGDLPLPLDDRLRTLAVPDAPATVLCLAWAQNGPHPGLPTFLKQARRAAYHR
ncbi:LysR family transcriptional regulator [Nocardia sp. BMG111209]|uniref:LysR family transcriptional regulator n=1 Tax=Nocardia sp. BMG111209 TaxID=1160137 RepID=UPI000381A470|nr:LysR family transcriptional regulator [Nocardia sp. BMG111209]